MSALLSAIMFVSGAAALLFETLWFRQAGLAFGNSVWASSLVLASFMAGLALGSGWVARRGDRVRHPIRVYALLEVAIAVTGVALVLALPRLAGALAPLWQPLLEQPWLLNPLRLALAFGLLLVPATAMGATLPVLVKALQAHDPHFGSVLGRLYGWNTLGAVVGSVSGELVLLEALGVRGSALAAGALDLLAAASAWLVWLRLGGRRAAHPPAPAAPPLGGRGWQLLAAAFLAGGILLAYEVVWFRFLQLFVLNSGLSFALMLAVVLAGIGVGGRLAGAALRRRPGVRALVAPLALLAGAVAVASYAGFERALAAQGQGFAIDVRHVLGFSAALMLPVSLLSGALFTLTGAALHAGGGPETRSAGLLTLANTVGAGLGAFVGGFLLLPLLGIERSVFGLAALYGVVALLLLGPAHALRGTARRGLAAASAVAFVASLLLFPFGAMREDYLDVVTRRFGAPDHLAISAIREGRTDTVVYLSANLMGEPTYHVLVTGGFAMAATGVFARRYMKQFVYWPVALHRGLRRALLISFGSGSTAKALTDQPDLERIDIVDISREVLETSDVVYPDPSQHPLRDPRVRVHVEDGRFYLLTTPERYDLITSEPPPPKHAGVVNLYTREYFGLLRARLAPGGVATYWIPVHTLSLDETRSIVRAWCEAFPDCALWTGWGFNWMLTGSNEGAWARSRAVFERQWRDPRRAAELRALGVEKPEQLGAMFMADAAQLVELLADAPALVDDFPKRLRDRLPSDDDAQALRSWMDPDLARERFRQSALVAELWPPALREATLDYFAAQQTVNALFFRDYGEPIPLARSIGPVHELLTGSDLRTLPLWLLNVNHDALWAAERLLARRHAPRALLPIVGARALAERRYARAARLFGSVAADDPRFAFLQAYAFGLAGRGAELDALLRSSRPAGDGDLPWAWLEQHVAAARGR